MRVKRWKFGPGALAPIVIDVALPVGHCRDHACGGQHRLGRLRGLRPTLGFLVVQRPGAAEAKLIALTCSPAPEGFARWSLRLLEEKVVELNIVAKVSDNTIGRTLKKTSSNRTAIGNG